SPNGKVVALGATYNPKGKLDGMIRLLDTGTGKEFHALNKHRENGAALVFSDDGKFLASGNKEGIFLWDPVSGNEHRQLKGDQAEVNSMAFSPNGKILLSAGQDKKVRLWDVATGKELRHWDSHLQNRFMKPVFSSDSKLLAAADDLIRLWEVDSG